MNAWSIVMGLLFMLWLFDALRLRARAKALLTLPQSDDKVDPEHRFICRGGRSLDHETRRSASAFALKEGLKVLVLVPEDLPTPEAMVCLQTIDIPNYRKNRISRSRMIGEAILVHNDVLERMDRNIVDPQSAADFALLADELKKYATTSMDIAVAPHLHSSRRAYSLEGRLQQLYFGPFGTPMVLLQLALLLLGVIYSPKMGLATLLLFAFQPLIVFTGSILKVPEVYVYSLFRPFLEAYTALQSVLYQRSVKSHAAVDRERSVYTSLMAEGTDRFFEAVRPDCPLCGHEKLSHMVTTGDLIQFKPGTFVIDRCESCNHMFQNPRLSIEGLGFYYRDFYDGLGEEKLEGIFGHGAGPYHERAKMLIGSAKPKRWLDVGGGHGHFCCLARDVFPDASFDVLDLSKSVEAAQRKGWTDRSYRGLFPEMAQSIAEAHDYDVISMSHYLEHTRDPQSEIEAAARILPKGGHLMIELPDPDCKFGQIFGRYWMPWFQPQHQHFLSTKNLEILLKANDFEPIKWHRGEAHRPVDIMVSVGLFINRIARPVDVPWLSKTSPFIRFWHKLVFFVCLPLLAAGRLADLILAPLMRRPGWANNYRVLARRMA
ncbi:MAG: class I SAM-dependent methyltransferase [Proteobacteria bacterium]|nr:MAG: class I SAM-dependent methyltransferase [Pseudomonadota bacterium]